MGFLVLKAKHLLSDGWTEKGNALQSDPPARDLPDKSKCSVSGGHRDRSDGGSDGTADGSASPVSLGAGLLENAGLAFPARFLSGSDRTTSGKAKHGRKRRSGSVFWSSRPRSGHRPALRARGAGPGVCSRWHLRSSNPPRDVGTILILLVRAETLRSRAVEQFIPENTGGRAEPGFELRFGKPFTLESEGTRECGSEPAGPTPPWSWRQPHATRAQMSENPPRGGKSAGV